jgi:beta-glucosidase
MRDTSEDTTALHNSLFGENFTWGVSSSAYQTEGFIDVDGKGRSIWDAFANRAGKVKNNDNGNIACEFYARYEGDIGLIRQLHIQNFRFSLSWSRILPDGTGVINQAGIDHYNRVIDCCLAQGIEPWVTIYHWDLPQALEDKGGWTNRQIIHWFTNYVSVCAKHFGDRVKHWMVINEPAVFTGAGYFFGIHAPGRVGINNFIAAIHHVLLSMVAGAKVLKALWPDAQVGTTFSCSHIEPASRRLKDVNAADRADALINRLFIEPLLGMGYPLSDMPVFRNLEKLYKEDDEKNMVFDFDFIGLQNYTREIIEHSFFTPYVNARMVKAAERKAPATEMGWEVYPPAIYHIIKKYSAYSKIRKIIITENGVAFRDEVVDGRVNDSKRIAFLQENIRQVLKAKEEGLNVHGYFIWTLTDNFEWAEGFHPRFGLIHVDFNTQKRTIKDSGYWYAGFLKR